MDNDIVDGYIKRHGMGKANKILTVLGKNQQFINALSTTVGQELLKDLIDMAETRLGTLLEMDIDKTKEKFMVARADYKAVISLLNKFQGKLAKHAELYAELKK